MLNTASHTHTLHRIDKNYAKCMVQYSNNHPISRSFLPPDFAGSSRIDAGKSTGFFRINTGNTKNMEAVFRFGIFPGFFPMISGRILPESTGSYRNLPEKIREIPDRNTASNFLVFSVAFRPFPSVRRSPWIYLVLF